MKAIHFLVAALAAPLALADGASQAAAASLSRSVEVQGSPAEVWAKVGPFCAIAQWHPAIGSCVDDRARPPTRTLVTRDGKATFVEVQTARSERSYSYAFTSAPIPVTGYSSTLRVLGKADGTSTVIWSGAYTPRAGKAAEANDALSGIYETGLQAIQKLFDR